MKVIRHEAVRMNCKTERCSRLPNCHQHGLDHIGSCEKRLTQMRADRNGISMKADVVEAFDASRTSWKHALIAAILMPLSDLTGLKPCATGRRIGNLQSINRQSNNN